jgi:hypothetical protein
VGRIFLATGIGGRSGIVIHIAQGILTLSVYRYLGMKSPSGKNLIRIAHPLIESWTAKRTATRKDGLRL